MRIRLGTTEAGNESPLVSFFVTEPRRVDGASFAVRCDSGQEPVSATRFPWVNQIALSARAFVTKLTSSNIGPLFEQLDALIFGNRFRIIRLKRAPDRK